MRTLAKLWLVLMLFLVIFGLMLMMGVVPALLIAAAVFCVIMTCAAIAYLEDTNP